MPCARNTRINANSVSLFPRERMRDITCERLALVKTSGMRFFEPQMNADERRCISLSASDGERDQG
jgi:hypothetical protein